MKNIHVLPTDKPSRLRINPKGKLIISNIPIGSKGETQNIFITSDEEIKEGDWFYSDDTNIISRYLYILPVKEVKKIIMTSDPNLIKDGVQAIPDDFLEWFVENPSCDSVKVKPLLSNNGNVLFGYKIIIPKEKDYFPDTYIGSILSSEDIVKDITELENQSFEGWTTDSIKGYLLACKNIKEKLM